MSAEISVIVPCCNHAAFLPKAIQSILVQKYADWEAIVINDGSTDDTAVVAARFRDPRIRYISQKNQGLSAARNTGILAAQGIYLAFLDADDEWEPDFLQRCIGVLRSSERLGGVYTLTKFIDRQGTVLPQVGGQVVSPASFRDRNLEGGFFPVHAVLVRADVVDRAGRFDRALTSEEDWDLWIRVAEHYQMQGIPEPLARYRVYPDSMSTNAARMHANRLAVLSKYFGPPEGYPATWPEEKRRAYGFAYRSTARQYIEQGQSDEGWGFLAQAVSTWPRLLERLDTFFELACGDQPSGYRGQAESLDIEGNGAQMLNRLDDLFNKTGPSLDLVHRPAYGNAYLALGILSDQAGRWSAARGYLFRAIRANPRLLASYPVMRRLLKLLAGSRLIGLGRRVLSHSQPASMKGDTA